ncbi:Putative protein C12orf50 like protein [Chelonia mydas]|uniref:Uncharacterized protein n=1 Tax=Chelonia mydas TaxID=8469 RepID=M7BEI6_CHEMY|nr:Putative protein C12orf50 like protein [Chelonia mydas]
MIRDEQNKPDKGKHIHNIDLRLYNIQEPKGSITDTPEVDASVASLTKDMIISSEVEFKPKEPTDRKMKATLKMDFEASSTTLQVPLAATCFARASFSWLVPSADSVTVKKPLAVRLCAHYGEREDVHISFANLDIWKYRLNFMYFPIDATLQKEVQEGTLHPAHTQEPVKGEYYRIQTPQENQSAKIMSSALNNELLKPMETGRDLQEGDGVTVPTKFNITERQGEVTASLDGNTRTDPGAFENGAMSHTEPVKKRHFKGVKKKKWISEEPKNSFSMFAGKAMHASNPKGKANCQQNDQSKDAENTSYVPSQRAIGRSISLNSPEPGRSTNMTYSNVSVTKESKPNPSTVSISDPEPFPIQKWQYSAGACGISVILPWSPAMEIAR